ncbi:MAG: endonuclease domain-containing protein [Hyphomicrobium sp.]
MSRQVMANERARQFRNSPTAAERKLWYQLRQLKTVGSTFRRQVPIDRFFVDFACLSKRVIVEIDGATYASESEITNDQVWQRYREDQGFVVLRRTNGDVMQNIEGVMDTIENVLSHRSAPSPQGGGE